ncbi:hypothetical protein BH11PSE4_BH11PSE4_09460 [soil metagenome]
MASRAARLAATLMLPLWLAGCGGLGLGGGSDRGISFTDDQGVAGQPFPQNYRTELLAFFRTYINDPVGIRDASLAEPVQRTVGGRLRYVACVRYTAKDSSGQYRAPQERAVTFVDGRLDHVVDNAADICAGATYLPFPEMQAMKR